jgi:hypothetical protein
MLWRVAQALRIVLLLTGSLLLVWLPLTWWFRLKLLAPLPRGPVIATGFSRGEFHLALMPSWMDPTLVDSSVELSRIDALSSGSVERAKLHWDHVWLPLPLGDVEWQWYSLDEIYLTLPLWFVSALCLAWPVTSLLVRRRRRGRGFEVEAKGGDAVSAADS